MVNSRTRGRSCICKTLLQVLLLVMLFGPGMLGAASQQEEGIVVPNPGADLWRDVRQRNPADAAAGPAQPRTLDVWRELQQRNALGPSPGTTQARGVDSGVLVNPFGDQWRQFRMEWLLPYGGYLLGGMLLFVILFYLIRGKVPIHAGASDKRLFRYSVFERTIHWFLASIFLFLALTGLIPRPAVEPMVMSATAVPPARSETVTVAVPVPPSAV